MARYSGKKMRFAKDTVKRIESSRPKVKPFSGTLEKITGAVKRLPGSIQALIKKKDPRSFKTPLPIQRMMSKFPSLKLKKLKRYSNTSYSVTDIVDSVTGIVQFIYYKIRNSKIAIIGISAGIAIVFTIILIIDFNSVRALASFQPNATTKVFDKNGLLISEIFLQKRDVVPLKKIPADLVNAFIAIEDNDFYDHWGVNPKGIVRAFFINLFSGRIRQGGSTITQQLSKILLTSGERSFYRKFKEACIALMMEATYSKDEIMSLYLNQIFLGHGTYGVEAAARYYYDKHVWDLNLAESSLLASLSSAPNQYSPIRHTKRAMQRHKMVLAKMVEMGFASVKKAEGAYLDFWTDYKDYVNELSPTMTTMSSRVNKAPWFTEYVRRELVKKYGNELVYEKGLLVYTTLDLKKQMAGQEILKKRLEKQTVSSGKLGYKNEDYIIDNYSDVVQLFSVLFGIPSYKKKGSREKEKINNFIREEIIEELDTLNCLVGISSVSKFIDKYKASFLDDRNFQKVEGCLISIDHRTGYIEAMVGGSEFTSANQLNRTLQSRRQPGSAIKPLVYVAAIESGEFTPAKTVLDSPVIFSDGEGGDWLPENYEGDYSGFVRLRKALALSINVVSIRIAEQIGIDMVIKNMAKLLKLDSREAKQRIQRNFSIALGSTEVSPLELTTAYGIIANGGKDVIPFAIRSVKDRKGNILENREEEVQKLLEEEEKEGTVQIIKPETAQILISMMQSVITSGTGSGASPGRPAAGKTGTTNNWKDAWFVGFTPQLTTGIWVGYDKMGLSLGIGQAGGAITAPMWGEYMREALKDEPVMDFPQYAGLASHEICTKSGLLPSSNCRETMEEVFVPGTVPKQVCNICSGSGDANIARKPPKDNITRDQKQTIKKMEKKEDSIIEHIDNDLLE